MKTANSLSILLMVLVLTASIAPSRAADLPAQYLGVWQWATHDGACKEADWGSRDNLLRLSPSKIEHWESSCQVTSLESTSEFKTNEFRVDLECSGEGERWRGRDIWHFTEVAGQQLAIFASMTQQNVSVYKKCGQ